MLVAIVQTRDLKKNSICRQAHYLTQRFSLTGRACVRIRSFSAITMYSIYARIYIEFDVERISIKYFCEGKTNWKINIFRYLKKGGVGNLKLTFSNIYFSIMFHLRIYSPSSPKKNTGK